MKAIISIILCFSIILSGCMTTTDLSAADRSDQQAALGTMAVIACSVGLLTIASITMAKKQKQKETFELQSCVGKTKLEVYQKYGPPDDIVDDAQGGTILIYRSIATSGGHNSSVYTRTYRKLIYVNGKNIVYSVKEDIK